MEVALGALSHSPCEKHKIIVLFSCLWFYSALDISSRFKLWSVKPIVVYKSLWIISLTFPGTFLSVGMPFCQEGIQDCVPGSECGALVGLQCWHTISSCIFSSIFSLAMQACLQLSKLIYLFQSCQSQLRPFCSGRAHQKPIPCACVARIIPPAPPAMCVALHQALNFTCCLIAQLGVILQPFCQPLLDFLVSDLTCRCCHLTSQVFPKSSVVLATAQTLAEGVWGIEKKRGPADPHLLLWKAATGVCRREGAALSAAFLYA